MTGKVNMERGMFDLLVLAHTGSRQVDKLMTCSLRLSMFSVQSHENFEYSHKTGLFRHRVVSFRDKDYHEII